MGDASAALRIDAGHSDAWLAGWLAGWLPGTGSVAEWCLLAHWLTGQPLVHAESQLITQHANNSMTS